MFVASSSDRRSSSARGEVLSDGASSINIGALVEHIHKQEFSFQNNFTDQFNAQNFSVCTPFHSGLVLNLGATDYLPGHIFLLDAFIADVPTISRHVFKSEI